MKLTIEDIESATDDLAILQYWPADPSARKGIMMLLAKMVGTREQLRWLVDTMINRVGTWHGPMELRGVYCQKYKPLDGQESNCVLSIGFTAADSESVWYDNESKRVAEQQKQWLSEAEAIKKLQ